MDQLYKKIEIEGEQGFPAEGEFWFHFKKSNFWKEGMQFWDVTKLISVHKDTAYLRSIDWYLIPFTPDSKAVIMPNEETVNEKYPTDTKLIAKSLNLPENMTEGVWEFLVKIAGLNENIRSAIKWFRSQVREVELKGELVKLLTMLERNGGNNFIDKEKIADDYLSARKEGEE